METDDQVFTLASYKSSQTIEPSFVNAILSSLPVHPEEPSTVSFGKSFFYIFPPRLCWNLAWHFEFWICLFSSTYLFSLISLAHVFSVKTTWRNPQSLFEIIDTSQIIWTLNPLKKGHFEKGLKSTKYRATNDSSIFWYAT